MSATIEANKADYVALMRRFANSEIGGETFRREFIDQRRRDIDKQYEKRKTWPERYDVKLQEDLLDRKISKDEFRTRWQELWGYETTRWLEIFDNIFDELDRYEPDEEVYKAAQNDPDESKRAYYITEDQLRETVRGFLKEIESSGPWGQA